MVMTIKSRTCFNIKGEPLTEYSSEYKAEEGANYAKRQYGRILYPYQCSKCGEWHLSPVKKGQCLNRKGEPLIEYESRDDAEEGIIYARENYESNLVPYFCKDCGKWHLAPQNRQTPSRTCEFCIDSSGKHKELYETEHGAAQRAKILEVEQGIKLRVYPCPHDSGYHLTKDIW